MASGGGHHAQVHVAERNPEIQVLSQEENRMRVLLSGTDTSVANALRRVMISEVPTVAIHLVTVQENTTILHDEFVSHRLGLVPFRFKRNHFSDDIMESFALYYDADPDAVNQASIDIPLALNVSNDGSEERKLVTSQDLYFLNPEHENLLEIAHFANTAEEQILHDSDGGIVLCKLGPRQKLKVECIAQLGTGKIHSKFSPVCTACLQYEPDIRLNHELLEHLTAEEKSRFVNDCQPEVFEYRPDTEQVVVADALAANNIDEIQKTGMKLSRAKGFSENIVTINIVPDKFYLEIETTGALTPAQVLLSALRILQSKMKNIQTWTEESRKGAGQDIGLQRSPDSMQSPEERDTQMY
eukprot:gb/GECG01010476.1/.p1 GENE.gb/GECG01010476.1/~~gb/GECG01010476.1/.p1  ORF type:complete len:356 (+),score=41.24 gb/GECG01010476.1/:1-1068(+)